MSQILKNNVSGVLQLPLSNSATSMVIRDAGEFPTPTGGDHYLVTLIGLNSNAQEAVWEIVKVTAKASNTLTIERAQEGTTAVSWPSGTWAQMRLTAGSVNALRERSNHLGFSAIDGGTANSTYPINGGA